MRQNQAEDLASLVFWLYNLTIWLHLMKCDDAIRETCELLDSYTLIEEILNSVFGAYASGSSMVCLMIVNCQYS